MNIDLLKIGTVYAAKKYLLPFKMAQIWMRLLYRKVCLPLLRGNEDIVQFTFTGAIFIIEIRALNLRAGP